MSGDSEGRVSSVRADKAAAGLGVTAPAVVPMPELEPLPGPPAWPDRWEESQVINPAGKIVTVRRNLDTGESEVVG